ncbi:DUF4862 family protein [Serinibacter salmoneus]|uniref:Uncharacterized protein DUF4862 n=1 Tax=Serinibacter salmoneus TaxID=556530 RepID=A0A2A9D2S6_9MICO|nr:DUF4862 family protein [Serinibacter salmoneus]PFG20646.1 uncharacterized protein DUF4862 [Serinibacter salmoneus]
MTTPTAPHHAEPGLLLGSYALPGHDSQEWYEQLEALGVTGLEFPTDGGPDLLTDARTIATHLDRVTPASWVFALTMIPVTMPALKRDDRYGLASPLESSRERAIADVGLALQVARELADISGKPRVVAVEVPSAPGQGEAAALTASLATLAADTPEGTMILLEHCDAAVPHQRAAKGFLDLPTEIAAIAAVDAAPGTLGLCLNWGRSAIEGRSVCTPLEHARLATASGLPVGAVLSGATDTQSEWGAPWSDTHIPPRGDDPALPRESLLDLGSATAFLAAARPDLLAAKVATRGARDEAHLLAVARATVEFTRAALAGSREVG